MYRTILTNTERILTKEKPPIILIIGLRQVGKSTLAQSLCKKKPTVRFNFDLLSDIAEFTNQDRNTLELFAKKYSGHTIIIDEVQKSQEAIGVIKHLYDTYHLRFILTGSSEIKIRQGIGDSLAGRVEEIKLYPLSLSEINIQKGLDFDDRLEFNNFEENQALLLRYLVYGSLPQLLNIPDADHISYLDNLTNNLLSKDVMEISGTRKPAQVFHLAKLLALQIGQIVNFNELASETNISRVSVVNYIEIFEQMGLVMRANPISTNKYESITKRAKIYFTDIGIRNSLLNNFGDFKQRPDKGQLLENAVYVGIRRTLDYQNVKYELGFFRSLYGKEIDIVRKTVNKEDLFEIKVGRKTRVKKNITYIDLGNAQKYLY